MSTFLEIDFVIKIHAKKVTTFRPLRGHFQVRVKNKNLGMNILETVKNR